MFGALSFQSCNSGQQTEESPAQDTTATTEPAVEENSDSVEVLLPSPLQIASLFKKSGLTYLDGLTSNPASASTYSSMNRKAMNVGVYTTDLAYCVLNKQTQKALDYIKTVRALGTQMGMGSVFENNSLVERFQKNLDKEDSLAYIIADLQMETDMYLESNDMKKFSGVIFSGAWIEALYLGAKVNEKKTSENISGKITEQMIILDKVIKVLKKDNAEDPDVKVILALLEEIQAYYNSIPAVKALRENEDEGSAKLSDEELKQLTSKIVELRQKIVNG